MDDILVIAYLAIIAGVIIGLVDVKTTSATDEFLNQLVLMFACVGPLLIFSVPLNTTKDLTKMVREVKNRYGVSDF